MSEVTLSFDNGPSPQVTPKVLAELSERGLSAYFCLVGTQLARGQEQVDIAKATLQAGHVLVNHSLTHKIPLGDEVSAFHCAQEIGAMDRVMNETLGHWASDATGDKWFRPFGRGGLLGPHIFSEAALCEFERSDYSVLLWNSVPRDWENTQGWVEVALLQIARQTHTVLVLHDLPTGAMTHLPRFLDAVHEAGHEFTLALPDDAVPIKRGQAVWSRERLAALVRS